jgi:hypothetical protein
VEPDPFGEKPKSSWWRVDSQDRPPTRYARPLALVVGIVAFVPDSAWGMDRIDRVLVLSLITIVPGLVLERSWKARNRRRAEVLRISPESQPDNAR